VDKVNKLSDSECYHHQNPLSSIYELCYSNNREDYETEGDVMAGHETPTQETESAYKIFIWKRKETRRTGRLSRSGTVKNIKLDLKGADYDNMTCIHSAQS
jgi:hypothetical protein